MGKNNRSQSRKASGNMIILITAVVFVIFALLLFALSFIRVIGSHAEQRTAIEAASLAAARDVSNIVINTPEFGYIGLSDSAPSGANTVAGDTFYTPVHSVNTLIGTVRLDMIIANDLGVPAFEELALNDLAAIKNRANQLFDVIEGSLTSTGSANDKHGNVVSPYVSAENAYQQNQIRMTGGSSYVPGSLQMQIGTILGGSATNVPVPQPASADGSLNSSNTIAGYYKSYVNIPYNGQDFYFQAVGDNAVILVDNSL